MDAVVDDAHATAATEKAAATKRKRTLCAALLLFVAAVIVSARPWESPPPPPAHVNGSRRTNASACFWASEAEYILPFNFTHSNGSQVLQGVPVHGTGVYGPASVPGDTVSCIFPDAQCGDQKGSCCDISDHNQTNGSAFRIFSILIPFLVMESYLIFFFSRGGVEQEIRSYP